MEDAASQPSRSSDKRSSAALAPSSSGGGNCLRAAKKWLLCGCAGRRQHKESANARGSFVSVTNGDNFGHGRHSNRLSGTGNRRPRSADQLAAERQLKQQIAHYSTMRVHMKRVQLCLEQEKRNKFYKELVIYLGFLAVIMVSLLSLPVHFPYEQNSSLANLYFDEQFPNVSVPFTFDDVGIEDELWQWASGPLLYQFYDSPVRNNRAIGSIQLRTGRVRGMPCSEVSGRGDFVVFTDEVCYPEFSTTNELKEPYGSTGSTVESSSSGSGSAVANVLQQQYTWSGDLGKLLRSQTFNPSLFNHEMDYGHGGYAVYLPRDNYTAAQEIVAQLQEDFFTDGTRYFAATLAFYNARSNIFTHVQALFEMSNTDYMEVTQRVKSFRILASYKTGADFVQDNVFVLILMIATLGLVYRELVDLRSFGVRKYINSLWNLLDMFQLVLLVIFLERWVTYLVEAEEIRDKLYEIADMDCSGPASDQDSAAACYVDLEPLAGLFFEINNFAAGLGLVSVAIVFKYLRLNTRLNLLWRTLRFAAKDLLAFVAIFFTMFFGFAVMGFLIFGSHTRGYHSLSVSLASCFQMLLGAFDYDEIYSANPAMASVFFFSFMISIYLICVNMFIAIMSEYYSIAQTEKKTHEQNAREIAESAPTKANSDEDADDFRDSLQFTDADYDLAKQVKKYVQGLRVRIRFPPKRDGATLYNTDQLLLCGFQRVLLVDYDYLMAERKRLRHKFRVAVHMVTTCLSMLRTVDPEYKMKLEPQLLVSRRPRASSTDSYADLAEFPVTYLPISSTIANTVEILKRLKRGMFIEMDDGSLTKDQITLEVLGDQDEYVPPRFKRQPLYSHDEDADGIDMRISEATSASEASALSTRRFGLQHTHAGIGGPRHIRACRVLYNGDTVLNGNETCVLPQRTWASYFTGFVFWGYIRRLFTCKRTKRKVNRLVTDVEVDRLIAESFAAPGRGISCRFDELVRNFRMFIAKKVHKRNMRIHNMEERIYTEVITFLERFPSALTPLDKREFEGYKYTPQPVNTSRVRLPGSVMLLAELLSHNAHEVWAQGRIEQGWRWGPARDNDTMLHPDLIPYEALTEQDKQYDRDTSISALKVITALGYILEPPTTTEEFNIEFGVPASEPGGTYDPKPIPTDDVKVPPHLRSVIELLAENTHEVWAKMRMEQGWKYGPRRDDTKKEHNGLVPYIYLTQEEKQMDRNTAMQTVKLILRCGFAFVHKDKVSSSRTKKKHSGHIKPFGRSENPEAHNVGDAVALARGTARAKRAFMSRGSGRRFPNYRSSSAFSLYSAGSSEYPPTGARTQSGAYARGLTSSSSIESDSVAPLAGGPSFYSMGSSDSIPAGEEEMLDHANTLDSSSNSSRNSDGSNDHSSSSENGDDSSGDGANVQGSESRQFV